MGNKGGPTWQDCMDAGLTASEAAALRGMARSGAYTWSARHNLKWPRARNPACMPVKIRGKTYPSQADAAKALGICQSIISHHLTTYGHADFVGLKQRGGQMGQSRDHLMNPVTIGPRTWKSRKALADYIGWGAGRVSRALGKQSNPRLVDRLLAAIMAADAEVMKQRQLAEMRRQQQEGKIAA